MSFIIKDGTGTGKVAKVNDENRLFTNAVTISDAGLANIKGKQFVVQTSEITLTSGSETAIFYLKNTSSETIITDLFSVSIGASTGGSGVSVSKLMRNPTAGTIVDNAVTMSVVNSNFGSVKILTADSYEGVEGDTMTDGTLFAEALLPSSTILVSELDIVLPSGSSMGFKFTPPSGNTSIVITLSVSLHLDGFTD